MIYTYVSFMPIVHLAKQIVTTFILDARIPATSRERQLEERQNVWHAPVERPPIAFSNLDISRHGETLSAHTFFHPRTSW